MNSMNSHSPYILDWFCAAFAKAHNVGAGGVTSTGQTMQQDINYAAKRNTQWRIRCDRRIGVKI